MSFVIFITYDYIMINCDDYTNENKTKYKMAKYSRSSSRTLIIRYSVSGKTNSLFNLINNQQDIYYIIWLYSKNPYEAKYQHLFNKRQKVDLRHYDDRKIFIEHSNDMQDIYKIIEEYNQGKNAKY